MQAAVAPGANAALALNDANTADSAIQHCKNALLREEQTKDATNTFYACAAAATVGNGPWSDMQGFRVSKV